MILADSSVWIDFWHKGDVGLQAALGANQVVLHPFVFGELFLGRFKDRQELLRDLRRLPEAPLASEAEVLGLVERFQLQGRGIGWIDAHLLSSALLSGADLLTHDLALKQAWLKVRPKR